MTRIAEIADRLHRLAKRREDEGIYTDAALCEEAAAYLTAAIGAGGQSYAQIVEPYTAAQRMIRDAIQELFGSVASLESEDATLLRGPEPHHEAEAQIDALMRVRDHIGAGGQAVAELHGPFGWLNGHRALAEDSWTLESDPLENSAEYFAVPLYALVDPFKEIGKDFDGKPSIAHPRPLPLKEEVERVLERAKTAFESDTLHDKTAALLDVDALLSRLRAGEQKGWKPIETADKDEGQLMLGIVRQGSLREIHIGGYRYAYNDDEVSCWWSDQADDEICPTHWMPLPASPSVSEGGSRG